MSAFPHHYAVYGVTLRANRPIAGLLPGPEDAAVTIDFAGPLAERPVSAPFFVSGVETLWHLDEERWLIEYSAPERGYVWTALHEPGRIEVRWNHDAILDDIAPILQGSCLSATLHLRAIPLLHASILAVDDVAIAIMGAPGAGKSTTAAAFVAAGYPLVSDDVGALDLSGPAMRVHSGYPRMRLYADSARAAGFEASALPRVFHEELLGDKRFVELPPTAFREGPLPLRAIYMLQPRSRQTAITALDARVSVPALMQNVYSLRFLDRKRLQDALVNCTRIVSATAIRTLRAADDLAALPALVEAIAGDARAVV
ncbi:MAG TPA: hypothetical protein VEK11_19395 [Thermoanaerobaculia bacterium]|nr:hypothetical protein [Thermoanaerobaculia bacterium]